MKRDSSFMSLGDGAFHRIAYSKSKLIDFPGVGHAPALMESAQIEPIRAFLRQKRL